MHNGRKTILVTGGTQGIGRAIVELLLKEDYEIHFTYKTSSKKAEEFCAQAPDRLFSHKLDQGHPEEIIAADWLVENDWDGIIFNAALGSATVKKYAQNPDELASGEDIALMTVNALGPLWIYKKVYPQLIKKTEHVKLIFISSVGGGITQFPAFSTGDGMSKSALTYMVKHLAAANIYTNVDIFSICPGSVDSAMSRASVMSNLKTQEELDAFIKGQAKSRLGQPSEYAYWIVQLLNEKSVLLHGANIDASAGMGVRPGILTEHM